MVFKNIIFFTTVVAVLVPTSACVANGISVPKKVSSPLFFNTEMSGYNKSIYSYYNLYGSARSSIDTIHTVEKTSQLEKNWKSSVYEPMWTPNMTLQCNSELFINNSVLTKFTLALAQLSERIPEMQHYFNIANLPNDVAEKVYAESWKDLFLKYSIPHANDIAKNLSKILSSKFEGVTPEDYKCNLGTAYGLPLFKVGILTAQNTNYLALKYVNFLRSAVKKADSTDVHDVYKRCLEGNEMFLEMAGINMVEELPKLLLNNAYYARFLGTR